MTSRHNSCYAYNRHILATDSPSILFAKSFVSVFFTVSLFLSLIFYDRLQSFIFIADSTLRASPNAFNACPIVSRAM